MGWLKDVSISLLHHSWKHIYAILFGMLVAMVGPALYMFYADVFSVLTWKSTLGAVFLSLSGLGAVALYLSEKWLDRKKQNEPRRWIKEKLLDLAQQAAETAAKIRNSTKPIEPQSSGAWRTPTPEVVAIKDQACMAITAHLGQQEGELFSSHRFGSVLPHGYAENLSAYLFALAEKLQC